MVGEDEIIFHSNGVNRNIILDIPKSPHSQRFSSFGL
jgi:hypothetical protein